jgi:hypothetical protein
MPVWRLVLAEEAILTADLILSLLTESIEIIVLSFP